MSSVSETPEIRENSALVVVDMLYDFIDGSMACLGAKEAVRQAASFIDKLTVSAETAGENDIYGQYPILFVCDRHPAGHCSFQGSGGQWPDHCVEGTRGSAVHEMLAPYMSEEFVFYKGCDKDKEQYSGYEGLNKAGQSVGEILDILDIDTVYLCGIATEFCVKATAMDLKSAGKEVILLKDALAYVSEEGHGKALTEMKKSGILMF